MTQDEQIKFSVVQGGEGEKFWTAIIREDIKAFEGQPNLDWLLEIDVEINGGTFPTREEAVTLQDFEDELEKIFKLHTDTHFMLRETTNGLRSVYYRISDPAPVATVLEDIISKRKYPREFEYRIRQDSNWRLMKAIPTLNALWKQSDS